jgi:hypothetical protein
MGGWIQNASIGEQGFVPCCGRKTKYIGLEKYHIFVRLPTSREPKVTQNAKNSFSLKFDMPSKNYNAIFFLSAFLSNLSPV